MTKHKPTYWTGPVRDTDDFGHPINDQFIDGRTHQGQWAIMHPASFEKHGIGIGLGKGQHYEAQADGSWLKVEG